MGEKVSIRLSPVRGSPQDKLRIRNRLQTRVSIRLSPVRGSPHHAALHGSADIGGFYPAIAGTWFATP